MCPCPRAFGSCITQHMSFTADCSFMQPKTLCAPSLRQICPNNQAPAFHGGHALDSNAINYHKHSLESFYTELLVLFTDACKSKRSCFGKQAGWSKQVAVGEGTGSDKEQGLYIVTHRKAAANEGKIGMRVEARKLRQQALHQQIIPTYTSFPGAVPLDSGIFKHFEYTRRKLHKCNRGCWSSCSDIVGIRPQICSYWKVSTWRGTLTKRWQ